MLHMELRSERHRKHCHVVREHIDCVVNGSYSVFVMLVGQEDQTRYFIK
jgi:hypothetical protein